jgi:hypothetical protein
VTGLHHSTDDERRRFHEILADDEQLAVFYDEHWCTPGTDGLLVFAQSSAGGTGTQEKLLALLKAANERAEASCHYRLSLCH